MKIITDNTTYVQKNDMTYLLNTDQAIPASIFMKFFGNDAIIIDDRNRYEFVCFDDPKEIEFFKKMDWMIDYNEVKDLSEEEIFALGKSAWSERNRLVAQYNAMTPNERSENQNIASQCELLEFKAFSLRDILWFKQGHITMELPKGIDLPAGMKQGKGIKKLFKTIFHKKKNF